MWYINGRVESLPLTDMRYISGWVVSLVLRRKAGDFFHISTERMERMKKTGFYIIKDSFLKICLIRISRGIKQVIDHIIMHIVKLDDSRESVFLIQDMFPITEEYIEREYTIAGNHLMLTSEHTAKVIEQKARKVLGMLKRGVKFMPTQPDVLSILEQLKQKK